MTDAATLRESLRQQRNSLGALRRQQHARRISRHFAHHPVFLRSRRIALYMAMGGEADPSQLLAQALARGTHCYLPRLQGRQMHFLRFCEHDTLLPNRYGIPEPGPSAAGISPHDLDLVLLPLVAFDGRGTRLGMGGGFYDRSFAFRLDGRERARPLLVGVAYGFQEVDSLQRQPWDVPLDGVLTEAGYRAF